MKRHYTKLVVLLFSFSASNAQTLTPIYVENDSIEVTKIQFINPSTGNNISTKIDRKLIYITEAFPDTIQIIVPFKNGSVLKVDSIESFFLYNQCTFSVMFGSPCRKCITMVYRWYDQPMIKFSEFKDCNNYLALGYIPGKYPDLKKDFGVDINYDFQSSLYYREKVIKYFNKIKKLRDVQQ